MLNLTANVTSAYGTPTGTVTFKSNGTAIGTATLSGGVATLAISSLPVGTDNLTAAYNGSTDYTASASGGL